MGDKKALLSEEKNNIIGKTRDHFKKIRKKKRKKKKKKRKLEIRKEHFMQRWA